MGFDFDSMEGGGEEDVGYEGGARKRSTPPPPPQHSDEKVLKFFYYLCFCRLFFQLLVYATGIPIDQQPHYIVIFSIIESSFSLSAPPVPVRSLRRRRRRRRRREGRRRRRDREPLRPRRGEQEQEEGGRVKQEEVHAQDSLYDKVRMGVAHSKQGALGNSLLFNQMKNIFLKSFDSRPPKFVATASPPPATEERRNKWSPPPKTTARYNDSK